jgi:hypothetical protein
MGGFGIRGAEQVLWPLLDVVIRLWLAQAFFVSACSWRRTGRTHSTLQPTISGELAGSGRAAGGVASSWGFHSSRVGLFSRRRCCRTDLSLMIQFNCLAFDAQLFWAALFGWYDRRGPISLTARLPGSFDSGAAGSPIIRLAGRCRLAGFSHTLVVHVAGCGAVGCRRQCASGSP